MILLQAATLAVTDIDRSTKLYTRWLDYIIVERGTVSATLARSWGAGQCEGCPFAVLQPASGAKIFLRLVEQPPVPGFQGLRTLGWNALEICVSDVLAVYERLKSSPFAIIGPPRENAGLTNIHPMQVKGPDEEVIFLTQINDDVPPFRLPRAHTLIDQIFIMVMGCSDMRAGTDWFTRHLGLAVGEEMEIAYTMLSKAYGKDPSTRFALTTMVHDQDVFLEIDQYPTEATPRPRPPGMLPPGCAMTTFQVPDWAGISGPWITEPEVQSGSIYGNRRCGTMTGPDGALIEIVEL